MNTTYSIADGTAFFRSRTTPRGKVVPAFQVDASIAATVSQSLWCDRGNGYLCTKISGKVVDLHRFAWQAVHGTAPDVIDHVNGELTDCRLCNLRASDRRRNTRNRHKPRNPRLLLPCWVARDKRRPKQFRASVRDGGKLYRLGQYATAEEAHAVAAAYVAEAVAVNAAMSARATPHAVDVQPSLTWHAGPRQPCQLSLWGNELDAELAGSTRRSRKGGAA